nr:NADH dehydrogenase subunit 5 [Stigmatomma silvestrii]
MINMIFFFFSMIIMFMIMMIFSLVLYYIDLVLIFEWMIFSLSSMNMELLIFLDWISCLFISVVLLISSMIMIYSIIYMNNEMFKDRFILLLVLFIFSMILMILSPNIISIMLGWDGLGVTSYCLVIYYQNYSSYCSGMLTVLSNRIGDVGLLMSISLMIMYGSWNFMMLKLDWLIIFMILMAAMTKSAQIPFSSWLPSAMAAPTPVSALVHSSTLVTAGVYLMIRFNKYMMNMELNFYLMYFAIFTMFMSGIMANLEYDMKKIIALSTLSQLGFMMMILSLGNSILAFYHLLMHAIFKSMLFMCAGIIIHSMNNNQDIRLYGNLSKFLPFTMMGFYIALLSLSGMLFLAGFYSKDLIMEMIYLKEVNLFMYMLILISIILTVMYSIRLFLYLFMGEMKFTSFINLNEDWVMNVSMMILIVFSIILGSVVNWLFFSFMIMPYLKLNLKLLTLILCLIGILLIIIVQFFFSLMKFYYLFYFLSSMWFLNYLWMWIYKPWVEYSLKFSLTDKGWVEYMWWSISIGMIFKFYNYLMSMKFKIFMFFNLFISILILMFLYI